MTAAVREQVPGAWTVEDYLRFLESRPDEERWQLIDGVAVMMTPPTLAHQRIARNLGRRLDDAFEAQGRELITLYEVGLIVPEFDAFRPEADVAVVDENVDYTSYATRFYLAAEVLSESNREEYIELKCQRYMSHPDNLYCLVIDQRQIKVEVRARRERWQPVVLTSGEATLALPEFGVSCPVGDLYRGTPLARIGPSNPPSNP